MWTYCSSFCLCSRSLISSLGTGAQRDSASALTRGTSDSIACLFVFIRCGTCKCRESVCGNRGYTSQFSRIKQRPPATDLSGPKASAESLTPQRSNLAETDTVDFKFDLYSSAAGLLVSADVLSDFGLPPMTRCFSFFFSQEKESQRLMTMLGQRGWWYGSGIRGFDRFHVCVCV